MLPPADTAEQTHDPNGKDTHGDLIAWPTWTKTTPTMLQYDSNGATLSLILDTYRQQPMQVLKDVGAPLAFLSLRDN